MQIERLQHLTLQGDVGAAHRLWEEARRRNDLSLAVVAATGLGSVDRLRALALEAWAANQPAACEAATRALGFVLGPADTAHIDTLITRANGRRRTRLLRRSDVMRTLCEARHNVAGVATHHAGDPARATTGICLVVRTPGGQMVAGIGSAEGGTTPNAVPDWDIADWDQHRAAYARAWADAAGDDQVHIEHVETPVDPHAASTSRRRSVLDRMLMAPASTEQWNHLVALFASWPTGTGRREAAEQVHQHYAEWAPETQKPMRDVAHSALHRFNPLYRHVSLDPAADIGWLDRHPSPESIASLEIIEHEPRTDAAALNRFFAALAEHPVLTNVSALTIRVRTPRTLRRLARMPIMASLSRLEVRTSDRLNLQWGKLYAELFLSCKQLKTFGLVHRGPLEYMVPALKRLKGVQDLRLHLRALGFARLEQLLTNLRANRPRRLDLTGTEIAGLGVPLLAEAPNLAGLEALVLTRTSLSGAHLQKLTRARFASKLRELNLDGLSLEGVDGNWLQALSALRELSCRSAAMDVGALVALLGEGSESVHTMDLSRNMLGVDGAGHLAKVSFPRLKQLDVSSCRLGDGGATALAKAPFFPGLHRFAAARNGIGDQGLRAVIAVADGLETLDVGHNDIGVRGIRHLSESRLTPSVVVLTGNVLGPKGIEALCRWPGLASVRHLELTGTRGGAGGKQALERAPNLDGWVTGVKGLDLTSAW